MPTGRRSSFMPAPTTTRPTLPATPATGSSAASLPSRRGRSPLFLEGLLARLLDAGQGHQDEQERGGDQEAEADRPLDEHHRIATRQQHGAPEVLLHLRAQ